MSVDPLKLAAAHAAADRVRDGLVMGLGSGSTMALFLAELGRRVREENLQIVGVPTSIQARLLAIERKIPIRDMTDVERLDLAIDGADEVDPAGRLIKGAGGAHVLEKIVAAAADRFIVVVDESKLVSRLGERFPCPVEVLPIALSYGTRRLRELGLEPQLRPAGGKVGPVISDNGNPIIDVRLTPGHDPERLDREINQIPGVVGHGLFIGLAHELLIARAGPQGPTIEHRTLPRP